MGIMSYILTVDFFIIVVKEASLSSSLEACLQPNKQKASVVLKGFFTLGKEIFIWHIKQVSQTN